MKKITGFGAVLRIEQLKSKHTRSKWAILLVGIFLPLMYLLGEFINPFIFNPINVPQEMVTHMFSDLLGIFSKFILPLGIVGLCTSITNVDYKMNGLQLMETQPIRKWTIFMAKFALLLLQIIATIVTLIISTILLAFALKFFKQPDASLYLYHIDIGFLLHSGFNVFLNAIAFAALIFAISANVSKSILVNILGSGLVIGYMIAVNLVQIPYYVPMRIMDVGSSALSETGRFITTFNWSSLIFGALYLFIGFAFYKYRNYKRYFFRNTKVVLGNIAVILVLIGAGLWMLQPTQIPAYHKTVIAGNFNPDAQLEKVIVLDANNALIAEIPVVNNAFYLELADSNIIPGSYKLVTNTKILFSGFYLSPKDSIYVDAVVLGNDVLQSKLSGTRIVENLAEKSTQSGYISYLEDISSNLKEGVTPKMFVENMENAEYDIEKRTADLRTADNITYRDDYKQLKAKFVDVKLIKIWDDYVKNYEFAHPEEKGKIVETDYIQTLRNRVGQDDETLINAPSYMDYVKSRIVKDIPYNNYGSVFEAISKQKPSKVKDYLLQGNFETLLSDWSVANDTILDFETKYKPMVTIPFVSNAITLGVQQRLNSVKSGTLPDFDFVNSNNEAQLLSQFLGKVVIIDVWASWCVPCLRTRPIVQNFAKSYKGKAVQFVAISIDKQEKDWRKKLGQEPNEMLDWLVKDEMDFGQYFGFKTIPRYIMLNKKGEVQVIEMPSPETQAFAQMIDMELAK